jgi:hypothetical protein
MLSSSYSAFFFFGFDFDFDAFFLSSAMAAILCVCVEVGFAQRALRSGVPRAHRPRTVHDESTSGFDAQWQKWKKC